MNRSPAARHHERRLRAARTTYTRWPGPSLRCEQEPVCGTGIASMAQNARTVCSNGGPPGTSGSSHENLYLEAVRLRNCNNAKRLRSARAGAVSARSRQSAIWVPAALAAQSDRFRKLPGPYPCIRVACIFDLRPYWWIDSFYTMRFCSVQRKENVR